MQQTEAQRRPHPNAGRLWGTPFQPGNSGNPYGKSKTRREQLIAEQMAEIAVEFGGVEALSPGDRVLLRGAAEELISPARPHNHEARTRSANIISRALSTIRRHRGTEREPEPESNGAPSELEKLAAGLVNGKQ